MIQCPKCQHSLSENDIKDIPFEYTSLVLCAHCGFGMDLRWQGRNSHIEAIPNVIIVGMNEDFIQKFNTALLMPSLSIKHSMSYQEALSIYAKALRKGEQQSIKSIILQQPSTYASWTEIILAFYSLQKAFNINDPLYLWVFAPMTTHQQDIKLLEELKPQTLCWFPCAAQEEAQHILAHVPNFLKQFG
jgi:hypothetical protein